MGMHFQAGGTIRPSRFVKWDSDNASVLEADANERTCGISTEAAPLAPIPSVTTNQYTDGDSMRVYTPSPGNDECLLYIGSGGVTAGAMVKSDADGKGVLAATTGTTTQWVGAEALETASEDELCRVRVVNYPFRPALA